MQKVKTLLLTGANNHDWRRTAPYCQALLQQTGAFEVHLVEDASAALEAGVADVGLFFLDYNGPDWSAQARSNFVAAVAAGAGVLVLHAANNAFTGWEEYEKLVGLLWREGTGHGEFHEFRVHLTQPGHPAVQGISDFEIEDELYHRLVNPHGVPVQVLATAFSAPEKGGTGQHEPVLMTTQYGLGRVFHTALGHVWPGDASAYRGATMVAVENAGFVATLLGGARWAAGLDEEN